jgi:selenide,water dikinase
VEPNDRVLIDFRTSDDAGVYRWESGPALVQTVDFFTPIVDDPYQYGQIAAANALSDIYAMGGRPLTALAIAGFPQKEVDSATIRTIFQGGFDKLREAGVALLGGHTVQDAEIKFGYAVSGAVDPSRVLSNAGARPGDRLVLTKPIGTGVIGTAIKFQRARAETIQRAIESMRQLNRAAAEAIGELPAGTAHACTDITGFGLIGHAVQMAAASGVTLRIDASNVPLLDDAMELVPENRSGGMSTNQTHFERSTRVSPSVDPNLLLLLHDPQTSGGLLICVAESRLDRAAAALERAGVRHAHIGDVVADNGVRMEIR